jgi:hypothetical protein
MQHACGRGEILIKVSRKTWREDNRVEDIGMDKSKVKQSRYTPWRRLGERRYSSYSFTTSALDRGEWSVSRPGCAFTPGERTPGTHCTGGWVGPRAGLDTEVKRKILCPCRASNPDRPIVQSVVRHYTAWAIPAPHMCGYPGNIKRTSRYREWRRGTPRLGAIATDGNMDQPGNLSFTKRTLVFMDVWELNPEEYRIPSYINWAPDREYDVTINH